MTQITEQTTHTVKTKGQDIVKTKLSNGVTLIDDLKTITAWNNLDKIILDQDGKKINGNYRDLDHAQKVSEALDAIGIIV